jgi:Flp pilus assembly protein TadD
MPDRVRRGTLAAALGVLTLVAFSPCLKNGFVATWDDGPNLIDNPYLRSPVRPAFAWAWRTYLLGVYQPLAWLLFRAQYAVLGLEPWGYHLVSLFWHGANVVLLFLLTCALLDRARPELATAECITGAALAAGLFAVHPLRVEVVAWASCQPYLPCVCFSVLSVLVYVRAPAQGSGRGLALAVCWVLYLAALLCKSLAVPLPLLLLVLDAYPLRRLGVGFRARGVWVEKMPFLILGGCFAVVAYRARSSLENYTQARTLSSRVAQAAFSTLYYPLKTVVPTGVLPFHPIPGGTDLGTPLFQLCVASALALSLTLFLARKRWPGLLAAWASYLVLLAPSSGIIPIGSMLVADRYSYLATMAGFVLVAGGIANLSSGAGLRRGNLVPVAVLALILGLIPVTWRQCRIWHSPEALWSETARCFARAVRADPTSAEAHHNLGIALYYCGRVDEAIDEFHAALKLDSARASTQGSLAQALIDLGRDEEAMTALSEAVRLDPKAPDLRGTRAFLLVRQGRLDAARAEYIEALRQQPRSAAWHAGLGVVLYGQGDVDAAASELAEAARLSPDDLKIRDQLRQVRRRQGRR